MLNVNTNIPFIKYRKYFYLISIALIIIGIGVGLIRGFNFGIDFTGGTKIQFNMGQQVELDDVKAVLKDNDIQADVIYAGENHEKVIIKTTAALDNDARNAFYASMEKKFDPKLPEGDVFVESSNLIGPSVGEMLKSNAIKAVLLAAVAMLIYIAIRFEWKFGVAAILDLLHDVLLLMAFYGLFHVQINSPFIAGMLIVVGYSINDTIVVFDRIRENLKFMKKNKMDELIDKSINQTIGRSIMTSVTTIIAIVPLFVLGGDSIREFTLPLLVGVTAGTVSSITMASPIYYDLCNLLNKPKYKGK
ncbi:protein translocase subunit SecF [Bacilliculturomica massiliensis]|uniref:protein translocase subunit SecF n=1 Tax=Bacilliculturomica massiliensis TaxID=1917867 RepID=UPI001030641B|nr:protein translocase subunit SecF [Bacilliculturomica massiliensis]